MQREEYNHVWSEGILDNRYHKSPFFVNSQIEKKIL